MSSPECVLLCAPMQKGGDVLVTRLSLLAPICQVFLILSLIVYIFNGFMSLGTCDFHLVKKV